MPVYEYVCEGCRTKFDRLVRSMRDDSRAKCPKCGSEKTARAMSVFAVNSDSAKGPSAGDASMCGRCGGAPGSCAM